MHFSTILALVFSVYSRRVAASCSFTGATNAPAQHLTDIATPTAFTFTDTNFVYDCATDPTTVSVWYTLNVAGTDYPAEYYNVLTFSTVPTVYATYTFPALTVTQFTPGEEVTVNWSVEPAGQTGLYSWSVPTQLAVITPTPTTASISSSPSTTSPTSTPSSSSSTPVGAIVGGVVGGVVVIALIAAFTWYKISTRRARQTTGNDFGDGYDVQQMNTVDKNPRVTIGDEQPQDPRVSLRYPDEDARPASGNLQGDY